MILDPNQGGDRWQQSRDIQKPEQLWPSSYLPLWQRHHGLSSHCKRRPSGLLPWTSLVTKDQVFPEGHIAPGTLIANTDTKHYQHLVDKIYRLQRYVFCHQTYSQVHPSLHNQKWHKTVPWVQREDLCWELHPNYRVLPSADQERWYSGGELIVRFHD